MIMRMLELYVRITFAPIPLAFGAQQGFTQDSIRYFRGVFACAAQPALMLAGVAAMPAIESALTSVFTGATGIMGSIACGLSYFVLSAYFGETKRLAQEIIAR